MSADPDNPEFMRVTADMVKAVQPHVAVKIMLEDNASLEKSRTWLSAAGVRVDDIEFACRSRHGAPSRAPFPDGASSSSTPLRSTGMVGGRIARRCQCHGRVDGVRVRLRGRGRLLWHNPRLAPRGTPHRLKEVSMTVSLLILAAAALTAASYQPRGDSAAPQAHRDYATLNVCEVVPGEAIARALGGTLAEARPFGDKSFSRCTYFVVPSGTSLRMGYVVYLQPPDDFEGLKQYIEDPITPISGLGDGAYIFHDSGDGRFKINVLKRGDVMIEATGDSAASARKVADAVVAVLWKKIP